MRSVTGRLTLQLVGVFGLAFVGFLCGIYFMMRENLSAGLDEELERRARVFHQRLIEEAEEVRRGVHPDLASILTGRLRIDGCRARVTTPEGKLLFASEGFDPGPGVGEGIRVGGIPFRVRQDRIRSSTGREYVVTFGMSEEPLRERLSRMRAFLAVLGPVVLVAVFLVAHVLVWSAFGPIGRFRACAARVGRENLSERIPEKGLSGEFLALARAFNAMLDRLEEGFHDLVHFSADTAHELRTPLANLRAEIETALNDTGSTGRDRRILADLLGEVVGMQRLVGDLLMLARADIRRLALNREKVRLRPLLEETVETWRVPADERGIRIDLEGDDVEIDADPVALRRVFMNLVHNSVTYNRDGGTVRVSVHRKDGEVSIEVRDSGPGIAPDELPKLFRRFHRVAPAHPRGAGGTGLGLAICKALVDAHGGRIEVRSSPGRGTSFTVQLPAPGDPASPAPVNDS